MKDNPYDFESNPILKHSFEFALMAVAYCRELEAQRDFAIANQLTRCGTSIGANMWEAQSPESKADFIHKCKIAMKEAAESEYWLLVCQKAPGFPAQNGHLEKVAEIRRILGSIINSSRHNNPFSFFLSFFF